jgi:hypothetical protein
LEERKRRLGLGEAPAVEQSEEESRRAAGNL